MREKEREKGCFSGKFRDFWFPKLQTRVKFEVTHGGSRAEQ